LQQRLELIDLSHHHGVEMRNDFRDDGAQDGADCDIEVGGISGYAAPEMISLGSSKELIQGGWSEGGLDYGSWYYH
jgi:hypothetical protein